MHACTCLEVDPSSVWLKDDITDSGFFPHSDGHFRLQEDSRVTPYCILLVEGPDQVTQSSSITQSSAITRSATGHTCTAFNSPLSSSQIMQAAGLGFHSITYSHKKIKSFNVKIKKAHLTKKGKKPKFTPTGLLYIEMLENNANIHVVMEAIKNKWGADFIIVTSDGLKLEDSPATRGE